MPPAAVPPTNPFADKITEYRQLAHNYNSMIESWAAHAEHEGLKTLGATPKGFALQDLARLAKVNSASSALISDLENGVQVASARDPAAWGALDPFIKAGEWLGFTGTHAGSYDSQLRNQKENYRVGTASALMAQGAEHQTAERLKALVVQDLAAGNFTRQNIQDYLQSLGVPYPDAKATDFVNNPGSIVEVLILPRRD